MIVCFSLERIYRKDITSSHVQLRWNFAYPWPVFGVVQTRFKGQIVYDVRVKMDNMDEGYVEVIDI